MKTKSLIIFGITGLILMTHSLFAQLDTLVFTPSNAMIKVEPYQLTWIQQVKEPDGSMREGINEIHDLVEIDTNKNGLVTVTRQLKWLDTAGNYYLKSDRLHLDNLQPLSVDIRWNPAHMDRSQFTDNVALGFTIKDEFSYPKISSHEFSAEGYSWSSDGFPLLVTNSIVFSEGPFYLQTLSGLPHTPATSKQLFECVGKETLVLDGLGRLNTRVIEKHSNNLQTTYWLSKEAPYIVSVRFEQDNGIITTWVIKDLEL